MLFTSIAHATGQAAEATGAAAGWQAQAAGFMPFILIGLVFYFLIIRPQSKKAKEHKTLVNTLQPGDEVMTAGGFYAKIVDASDERTVTVDLGGIKVRMARGGISGKIPAEK